MCYMKCKLIHVDRDWCDLVVFFPEGESPDGIDFVERISRKEAEEHWKILEPKLTKFYTTHFAPPNLCH